MKYQKIINLLDNALNQPSKFGAKGCVEINDDVRGNYSTNSQIKRNTKRKIYITRKKTENH